MASPIHLDRSDVGVVVHCTACGHWALYRSSLAGAWDAACEHEESVHPALSHQRNARRQREYQQRLDGLSA